MTVLTLPTPDRDAMRAFLVALLGTPSPTGYPAESLALLEHRFAGLAKTGMTMTRTRKDALLVVWPGEDDGGPMRAITAHCDTLGAMVRAIKPDGRLMLTQLGSYMWNAVEFEGVTVRTADDRRIRGTIVPANPSTHVNRDIATAQRTEALMEVRLDILTTSAAETRAHGIEVGDFVFLDPRVEVGEAGFIRSRHLDDKAGAAALYAAVAALAASGLRPVGRIEMLFSHYEEVGHGGAAGYTRTPDELIAVDMAAIGVHQNSTDMHCTICAKDSSGPYHFGLTERLRGLAAAHDIPIRMDTYPFYSSDGSAWWRAGGDTAVALIGPGVDASHAYERTHENAVLDTARLIMAWMLSDPLRR
jgi:putative aminopeptidase FrvX